MIFAVLLLAVPWLGACGEGEEESLPISCSVPTGKYVGRFCEQPGTEPETEESLPVSCSDPTATGEYVGQFCGQPGPFIITREVPCKEALDNCELNASLNPDESVVCWWSGKMIFRQETSPGACKNVTTPPRP